MLSKDGTTCLLHFSIAIVFIGGIFLTIGLVGEKQWDSGKHDKWKYGVAENLVILGVLIELIGDGGVFFSSERLQAISDHEVAILNKEAGDARRDAGTANERAANAERDTAKIERDNVKLRRVLTRPEFVVDDSEGAFSKLK